MLVIKGRYPSVDQDVLFCEPPLSFLAVALKLNEIRAAQGLCSVEREDDSG
jgi:hypothetical protein